MKKLSVISLLVLICVCFNFTACGVTDVFDDIVETTVSESQGETAVSSEMADVEVRYADKTIAEPQFNNPFGFTIPLALGTSYTMDGTCISSDGGVITYQWYVNNINSNSGGTVIDGATESRYTTNTTEVGPQYFYVVASNNHGNRYNTATSDTVEVITYNGGEWVADERGTRYVAEDGTYLSSLWIWIGDDVYRFDEEGYRTVGWVSPEDLHYFDEEGRLLRNGTTPDGCTTDGEGLLLTGTPVLFYNAQVIDDAAPAEGETVPAEEESPVDAAPDDGGAPEEEAPPEEAPVEETPVEESPVDEAPAEEPAPEG